MRKFSIKLKKQIKPSERYDYNKSYIENLPAIKQIIRRQTTENK